MTTDTSPQGPLRQGQSHEPRVVTVPVPPPPREQVSDDELAGTVQPEASSDDQLKHVGTAYLLWLLLGVFGGHRFYLDKSGSAMAMLCLTVSSLVFTLVVIGFVGVFVVVVWWLVDLFLIPVWIHAHNERVRHAVSRQIWVDDRRQ